jgi:threonyl-tRNA synthetase
MPKIKLPDGKNISFSKSVTGNEVAEKISKSLLKQALIMTVDGQQKDLCHLIDGDCEVKIFTSKDKEGIETIRHDTAHILAMAVQEIFPGTQVTIGPVIENGFYYDFARKEPFTEEDLNKIENKMKEIVDRNVQLVKFGKEIKQYLILKIKVKSINQS